MAETPPARLGKRLRQERELRHWTQEQLAERIGRSVPSINRWEHDRTEPQPDALQELTALFGKPPDRWGMSRWNVPFLRNPYFTGREQLLLSLHRTLAAENTVTLSQTRAISGLGGIGKTQLAIEYAYRYAHEYEAVLWVQADSPELLASEFARLAQTLELPAREEKEQWRIVIAVKRWLTDHTGWLLILDNADDLRSIADFLPRGVSGATLVTTRSQLTGKFARSIAVDKMEMSEGIRFLLRRATLLLDDEPLETVSVATRTAAQQLVEELDGLPLALDQAGAYIEETGCSLSEYLALYTRHRLALLRRESSTGSEYPHTVASTWTLSFSQIEQTNPVAADLLRVCAFLHPDAIPENILTAEATALGPFLQQVATEPLLLNEVIQLLRRYSLIKRDAEAKLLHQHRLVQVVLKESLDSPGQRLWAERVVLAVNAAFPQVEHSTWTQCELLMPHALLAVQYIEEHQIIREEAGTLLYEIASYLYDRARYADAESFYQKALHLREQRSGKEHLDVAVSLDGLANLYRDRGRYAESESLHVQALHIREHQLGSEHPEVARSLSGLANLYLDQGRYAESERLHMQALTICEQQLGTEHLQVAASLNSLGLLYKEQGRYVEAEKFYLRSLAIREQQLEPEHPLMGGSFNNLAILYMTQGKYAEAEVLYQRSLTIAIHAYGEDNPIVATRLNNLGSIYYEQKRYTDALSVFQRGLYLWEQHLGETHPYVATALGNLAETYATQGEYAEVESLYKRALDIWAQQSIPEQSAVARLLDGLANLYHKQDRYEAAEPVYRQALAIHEKVKGLEHPETATVMYNLAQLKEEQGDREEAEKLYRRALAIQERTLGTHHPKTSITRQHLAALFHIMGQHEEAARLEVVQSEQRTDEEERKTYSEE